ncbi:MAG: SDR family oxidoreductase [Rhizobiaceae bacterium]|nr:SDR family oxidoreductase [Rhizobiaceae bacterium]
MNETRAGSPGTAVVTGAASERGIGRTVATRLAAGGWNLGLIDRDGEAVRSLASELSDRHGVRISAAATSIADEAGVDEAGRRFEAELPAMTAVINIAGISDPTPFTQTSVERWNNVLNINATGTFIVTRRFLPGMLERRYGRIVSLSSTAAQSGGGTYSAAAYAAAKCAIEGMTRGLAIEVAGRGVTANAIAPAIIDTDIMGGRITEDRMDYFTSRLPVGRLGKVSEVAALIEFLIGEEAGFITGATYNINGGARIG